MLLGKSVETFILIPANSYPTTRLQQTAASKKGKERKRKEKKGKERRKEERKKEEKEEKEERRKDWYVPNSGVSVGRRERKRREGKFSGV